MEIAEKPKRINLDACKLITEQGSSWTTTFSIRLRERCPDHLRAFVQIVFEDLNSRDESDNSTANPILLQLESLELTPIKGTCFVSGCNKRGQTVKVTHDEACIHVMSCINRGDLIESEPFTLKHSVLNAMSISSEWKHTIWLKARRDGPLVQRVAPFTMAVKCDKDDNYPLGYLHTSFLSNNSDNNGGYRFSCTCNLAAPSKKKNVSIGELYESFFCLQGGACEIPVPK